jgi:hypothetical protein
MANKLTLLLALHFIFGLSLKAQTVVYKAELELHPDNKNKSGCILSIHDIHQNFDMNNNIKWEFNVQEFTPTVDAEQYLASVIKKEWSITLIHKQNNEKLQAQSLTNEESIINAECLFNGIIIPIDIFIHKRKSAHSSFYNELSFSLTGHQVGANSDDVFFFVMKLTPQ